MLFIQNKYGAKEEYKILLHPPVDQDQLAWEIEDLQRSAATWAGSRQHGGHNKKVLLNVNSFKKCCLKTDTKKEDDESDQSSV
jgi:hypothetical protein